MSSAMGLLLALIAGGSTLLGALPVLCVKKMNMWFYSIGLAFSAGTILYISLVEFFIEGTEKIVSGLRKTKAISVEAHLVALSYSMALCCFLSGWMICVAFSLLLEFISAKSENFSPQPLKRQPLKRQPLKQRESFAHQLDPQNSHSETICTTTSTPAEQRKGSNPLTIQEMTPLNIATNSLHMSQLGVLAAIVMGIHNVPEGVITYLSSISSFKMGISVGVAVALHNIPEGFSVAWPIFYSTGSKSKAILMTAASGLAEPVGALMAFAFIRHDNVDQIALGTLVSGISGLMTCMAIREIFPTAITVAGGFGNWLSLAFLLGMVVIAVTVILLELLSF